MISDGGAPINTLLGPLIGGLYTLTLAGLALYALHIAALIGLYLWHRRDPVPVPAPLTGIYPYVTVQIPLRNEHDVALRILAAVAAFDWPRDHLEIQVLDDSSDGTTALLHAEAERLRQAGCEITILHRAAPQGYKAGALAEGLRQARGEFIAIFDADFCPAPDFLRRTIPHLIRDAELGMVQARWGHLNAEDSPITRAQALALDAHFTVEHLARNRSGLLINFNGTAGVWRKAAIEEAGGWQSDTLTEDLDLSYRAQLRGWRALYLPDVVAPAELPPLMLAFKQQQYRWAKGAAQTLRKLAGALLSSPRLTLAQKIFALLHLSGYFSQPLLLLLALFTLPLSLYSPPLSQLVAFLGSITAIPPLLYLLGQIALHRDWPRRIIYYPVLMLLGLGLTWNTTLALWDGLWHSGGVFERTPKYNTRHPRLYLEWRPRDRALAGDLLLAGYAWFAVWHITQLREINLLPFVLLYAMGELLFISAALRQQLHPSAGQ